MSVIMGTLPSSIRLCARKIISHPEVLSSQFHTCELKNAWAKEGTRKKWLLLNDKVYPPQAPDEEPRPAYVCHVKENIKYSPWKMWYLACLVRGLTVDEAIKQLTFVNKKGASFIKDTILEAQEMAIKEHNVEFKTNLWVAESLTSKGQVVKGYRRHARARFGKVEYFYCHYFVRLEEGTPPEHYYYHSRPRTGSELLEEWLTNMRRRKITNSL